MIFWIDLLMIAKKHLYKQLKLNYSLFIYKLLMLYLSCKEAINSFNIFKLE